MHQVSSSPLVSRSISTWGGWVGGAGFGSAPIKRTIMGTDLIKKCSVFPKLHFVFWPLPDFVFVFYMSSRFLQLLHSHLGQGSGKSASKKRLVDAYVYMFTSRFCAIIFQKPPPNEKKPSNNFYYTFSLHMGSK